MSALEDIVNRLSSYVEKNVEVLPILVGFLYSMNIDPIIVQISKKIPQIDVVDLKQVLSSVRRLIYSTSMTDMESPSMDDISKIEEKKYKICIDLQNRYCNRLIEHLKNIENNVDKNYLKKLAIILRVCDRQKMLRDSIIRISMRADIVKGWLRGVRDCLSDLGYQVEDKFQDIVNEGLDVIVERSLPIGYASYNVLIVPACLEDYCENIVKRYGNVKTLFNFV